MHSDTSGQVSEDDLVVLEQQLGRVPRGVEAIAARCVCGRPLVVRTAPRLPDGSPFPTLYYLTAPHIITAVSSLEATGVMQQMNDLLYADEGMLHQYEHAHELYLADRDRSAHVPEIEGISAGGMPRRVKCLHALVAHSLAVGRGVNPIGDATLDRIRDVWRPDACTCSDIETKS